MRFRFTLSSEYYGSLTLGKDPRGWKDMETIIKRGLEFHGTFYETMIQLEFTCGSGKEYIDKAYEEYGVDAVVDILIQISCSSGSGPVSANDYSDDYSDDYGSMIQGSGQPVFETFYEGVLDFSKYNKTSKSTFVDILQSDVIQKFLNRLDTKVDVLSPESLDNVALAPIDGFPSDIRLHSKEIILESKWVGFDYEEEKFLFPVFSTVYANTPFISILDEVGGAQDASIPYITNAQDDEDDRDTQFLTPFYVNNTGSSFATEIEYLVDVTFTVVFPITATLTISLNFKHDVTGDPGDGTGVTNIIYTLPTQEYLEGVPYTKTIQVSGSEFVTINNNKKEYLYIIIPNVPTGASGSNIIFNVVANEFSLRLTDSSLAPASDTQIFKIHELGSAICERITSEPRSFRSTLLGRRNSEPVSYDENGCGSFMGSLTGKHVRGFPIATNPYTISINDFYKSMNSILSVGIGFEKNVLGRYIIRMEEKAYFYDSEVILQCPFAKDIKTSVAKEYFVSDIYIGYEEWRVENINGLDEFNSTREYNTGIKSIENRLNLQSPMVAGMYALELSRRKGVTTTDDEYDDKNFIICLKRTLDGDGNPVELNRAEKDENFDVVNNIFSPETSYNLRISPARNLLNHLNVIAGSLTKYAGRAIKFVSGEGNYKAETELDSDTCPNNFDNHLLIENQDIPLTDVTPLWIPEYIEFDYPIGFNTFLNLKANPYKCIEVSDTDENFVKGYIIEIHYKPVGGMASFKLLRAWP